jgi:hypothetical protein
MSAHLGEGVAAALTRLVEIVTADEIVVDVAYGELGDVLIDADPAIPQRT